MTNFDWHTDEDAEQLDWQDDQEPSHKPKLSSKWKWRGLMLVMLLLIGAGGFLYWQTEKRVSAATEATKNDIIDTHMLMMATAGEGDVDLFKANLSGSDVNWTDEQITAVSEQQFFMRQSYQLMFRSAGPPNKPTLDDITLSNNFMAAEVRYTQPYIVDLTGGITETVTLAYTAVYRQGTDRWLYAPPRRDFWGDWKTYSYSHLEIAALEREDELISEYGPRLNRYIQQLCVGGGFVCDDDWQLQVRFAPDEQLGFGNTRFDLIREDASTQLNLPTPTLIGIPEETAVTDPLFNQYTQIVLFKAMAELAGYECCQARHLFNEVVAKQLSELGIRPFPITTEDYTAVYNEWDQLAVRQLWYSPVSTPLESLHAQIAFAYIQAEQPTITNADLIEGISQQDDFDYLDWLEQFFGEAYRADGVFEAQLEQFILSQSTYAKTEPLTSLPTADIQLQCQDNFRRLLALHKYDLQTHSWQTYFEYQSPEGENSFVYVSPFGTNGEFLLFDNDIPDNLQDSEVSQTIFIWINEQLVPLTAYDVTNINLQGRSYDKDRNRLQIEMVDTTTNEFNYITFDLNQCNASGCKQIETPFFPDGLWSPNGNLLLFNDIQRLTSPPVLAGDILVSNSEGELVDNIADYSRNAFWIDATHIGYIQFETVSESWQFMVHDLDSGQSSAVFTDEVIHTHIPPEYQDTSWQISHIYSNSDNERFILVASNVAIASTLPPAHFLIDLNVSEGANAPEVEFVGLLGPDVSVDINEDWLMYINYSSFDGIFFETVLQNIETEQNYTFSTTQFPFNLWSPDKNWLIYGRNLQTIALIEPNSGHQQLIPHPYSNCDILGWVE